jgi:Protein of unknown function (DUF4239)
MTDFVYGMPIWVTTIVVLVLALAIGLGASVGVQKLFRIRSTKEEKEVAINLMQVVAAYVGIMIAFAGVQVWQEFSDAKAAVAHEAATASQLYQDLTIFGPETRPARGALRAYVVSITRDEWPQLDRGRGSQVTEAALQRVFAEIGSLNPADNRAGAIYEEMLSKLNDLVDYRHDRIVESQAGIPLLLWTIGLVGALLTVAYASAFTPTRFNISMIAGISFALGLVFLFILTVDHPFKGEFSVSNRHLVELTGVFDRLDRLALATQGKVTELR